MNISSINSIKFQTQNFRKNNTKTNVISKSCKSNENMLLNSLSFMASTGQVKTKALEEFSSAELESTVKAFITKYGDNTDVTPEMVQEAALISQSAKKLAEKTMKSIDPNSEEIKIASMENKVSQRASGLYNFAYINKNKIRQEGRQIAPHRWLYPDDKGKEILFEIHDNDAVVSAEEYLPDGTRGHYCYYKANKLEHYAEADGKLGDPITVAKKRLDIWPDCLYTENYMQNNENMKSVETSTRRIGINNCNCSCTEIWIGDVEKTNPQGTTEAELFASFTRDSREKSQPAEIKTKNIDMVFRDEQLEFLRYRMNDIIYSFSFNNTNGLLTKYNSRTDF